MESSRFVTISRRHLHARHSGQITLRCFRGGLQNSWMLRGRLNAFQKSMLQWNEMHPYSAIHVAKICGKLDAPRLRSCIHDTLSNRGLGLLRLDRNQSTFEYEPGLAQCVIETISGDHAAVVNEMERQLNLPFEFEKPFSPFRFFMAPDGDAFYLGIVYFHPVSDAESVVRLLKEIVLSYLGKGKAAGALNLYPEGGAHLMRRHPTLLFRKLFALAAQVRNLRGSYRVRYCNAEEMANGFAFFSLEPEDLRVLVLGAKSWSVTVNDMFLALLMKSLAPDASGRKQARRRRKISVGCIVNARKDLGVDSAQVFGLFLGSFTVTHEVPDGIGLRKLAEDIREQTWRVKRHRLYLAAPLELSFARFMLRFFSPSGRRRFYAKYYPLWGGITNMNLNSLWADKTADAPLDYFRAVSTGPVTPLVLSVTTLGERVNLGVSYRTAAFRSSDIQGFGSRFREYLNEARTAP